MNHRAIKITMEGSTLQVEFDDKDKADILALAKRVRNKKDKTIPPEFLIEVLARSLLAQKGEKTDPKGTVRNW